MLSTRSALAEVKRALAALQAQVEGETVAVVDGRTADVLATSGAGADAFWEAFRQLGCFRLDWGNWDGTLLAEERVQIACNCGRHFIGAFLIHRRWILMAIACMPLVSVHDASELLVTTGEAAVARALRALEVFLPFDPDARHASPVDPGRGGSGGSSAPAELGIPVSWVRRRLFGER
jgi:hypothetical protein